MILNFFLLPVSPVLLLATTAVLLIFLETLLPGNRGKFIKLSVALVGPVLAITILSAFLSGGSENLSAVNSTEIPSWLAEFIQTYRLDSVSVGFFIAISFFTLLSLVFLESFLGDYSEKTEVFSLVLFASSGMMLLVSAGSFLMVFMALELMSLPTYVLVALRKTDLRSSEAGLKYFLYGSFATVLLVLAIALLYGQFGTLSLNQITALLAKESEMSLVTLSSFGLLLVAVGFKIGLAPFHLWVPDAYQGAPTPITGFMGSAIKLTGFGLAIRLFMETFSPLVVGYSQPLGFLAVLTMFIGNLAALKQTDLKRLFAYSSISHAGYLFLGIVSGAGTTPQPFPVQYYLWIYGLLFLGTFGLLSVIEVNKKSLDLNRLDGLGFQKPVLGFCLMLFTLSAAGIPPTAGFFAKYFIFLQALDTRKHLWVVLAVISSLIGMVYYLKVISHLYMKPAAGSEVVFVPIPKAAFWAIITCALSMFYFSFRVYVPGQG